MCPCDLLAELSVQFKMVTLFLTMVFPMEIEPCSMESSWNPYGLVHGIQGGIRRLSPPCHFEFHVENFESALPF
jgi:hypothetical protein